MSNALEQFERSLVRASRSLHAERTVLARPVEVGATRAPRTARVWRAVRRRRWRIPAGALLVGVLAAAGASVFGPSGNPREITQIQCGQRGSSVFVTGEPLRDCATLWPSLFHRTAPRLVAWVAQTGGVVVVTPVGHSPAGAGWQRLPSDWKADAAVLGLHLQLEDITTGFEAHACWSARAARALATSILRADGLGAWGVRVHEDQADGAQEEQADGAHPNCLTVVSVVGVEPHTVLLVEARVQDAGDPARLVNTPSGPAEHARLTVTEAEVNRALKAGRGCANVTRAAELWRSRAAAAGIPDARYVLFTQLGAAAGQCARVFVDSPGGGGAADVYAADLP